MTRRKPFAASLLLLGLVVAGAAELPAHDPTTDQCKTDENVLECIGRRFNQSKDDDTAGKAAQKKIAATPSADQSPDSASTVRDFLPVFFTSVGLGTATESDETLTLTFNPKKLRGANSQWSLEARIREAEALDKLVTQAPEADRASVEKAISDQLGDFDDVEVSTTYSIRTAKYGRDFEKHSDMASRFLAELASPFQLPDKEKARQKLVDTLGAGAHTAHLATDFSDLPAAVAVEFEQLVSDAQIELEAERKGLKKALTQNSYFKLANLVNNQPQVTATLKLRERDDLVGQDSVTVNVTYEWGQVNVNRFRRWCMQEKGVDPPTAECLAAYWKKVGAKARYLPRLKLALDWEALDDLDVSFTPPAAAQQTGDAEGGNPAPGMQPAPVSLELASTDKIVGTAAWGRYLQIDDEGNQLSRLDIEARYEYVEDDITRNKRYVGSATFTQRISAGASATLSLVYASDPEFRGEVEKEFSARAGLKFKIDRKKNE